MKSMVISLLLTGLGAGVAAAGQPPDVETPEARRNRLVSQRDLLERFIEINNGSIAKLDELARDSERQAQRYDAQKMYGAALQLRSQALGSRQDAGAKRQQNRDYRTRIAAINACVAR